MPSAGLLDYYYYSIRWLTLPTGLPAYGSFQALYDLPLPPPDLIPLVVLPVTDSASTALTRNCAPRFFY